MDQNKQVNDGGNIVNLDDLAIGNPVGSQIPQTQNKISATNWFDLSVSKKIIIIPMTLLVQDMVGKYLGITPKRNKSKVEAMLHVDDKIKHWIEDI